MKKSTSEKLMNLLGVAAGNAILALAVVAFIVPAGIPMGGATGLGIAGRSEEHTSELQSPWN